MTNAYRDENRIPTLIAVSSSDGVTPVTLYADPTTHRLLVDLSGAGTGDVSGPGAAVTDNAVARWNGTTGTDIQNSIISISDTGILAPVTTDTGALGSGTLMWSDLFLASGAVINFNNGNATLTHGAGILTLGGSGAVTLALGTNSITMTGSLGATGARLTKGWFTDLEVTNAIAGSITGNAATVTTNANLTGAVTSIGNATTMNSAIDDLTDVTIASPAVDQILRYNGTAWVNGSGVIASGSPGIEFFQASPTITATGTNNANIINTLSKTPVVTAEQTTAISAVSNTVLGAAFLYNTVLGRTSIPAGTWTFNTYAGVNSVAAGRVSSVTRNVYSVLPQDGGAITVTTTGSGTSRTATASGGTPFAVSKIDASATNTDASYLQTPQGLYQITARTNDTTVTITTPTTYVNESGVTFNVWKKLFGSVSPTITSISPTYELLTTISSQAAFTITAAHKLGSILYGTSNNTTTITVPYDGTTHNTHFDSTLTTVHGELAGLQGGTGTFPTEEYYHLTSAEYTGTGTDVFVRKTAPTFVTSITTPSVLATANDSGALGASGTAFSDLFLASGAVINFAAGNATLTHSSGLLTSNVPLSLGTSNAFTTGTIELGHASDTTLARVSAGVVSIENVNILTVAGGTLTGAINLGENAGLAYDAVLSADEKWSGITTSGTLGATIGVGDIVYLAAADSRWELADASAASTSGDVPVAICLVAGNDGDATTLLLVGKVRSAAFPAFTVATPLYISETAGDITGTAPTTTDSVMRRVGFALTAEDLYFNPSNDYVTHT